MKIDNLVIDYLDKHYRVANSWICNRRTGVHTRLAHGQQLELKVIFSLPDNVTTDLFEKWFKDNGGRLSSIGYYKKDVEVICVTTWGRRP